MIESLAEYLGDFQVKERLEERMEMRRKARENYNIKFWDSAKGRFKELSFADKEFITSLVNPQEYGERHGKDNHTLQSYSLDRKVAGFTVCWKYQYCPVCNKVWSKKGVLLNDYENLALVKHYMKNGEDVKKEVTSTISPKYVDPLSVFDGALGISLNFEGGDKNDE
jgi:hypothetical protein